MLISDYHKCYDYDYHCKRCERNASHCPLKKHFISKQENPMVLICYLGKYFIYICYMTERYQSVCLTSGLSELSECSCQRDVSNITLELSENHTDTCCNSVAGTWQLGNI